jgi:PAS domain S-box-containing protein
MSDTKKTREELLMELKALREENKQLRLQNLKQHKENRSTEDPQKTQGAIEKKLIESEQRFRQLFNMTPAISVQGYDKNRNVIFWNKASEVLYGFTKDEAMGKKLENLIIPEKAKKQVVSDINNWIKKDIPIANGELILKRADGSDINVFSSHCMLKNVYGEFEMYCIDIDLDPLKKAEKELIINQSRLQLAIEVAQIGYWDYDCKTNKVEWSDGHHKLYGIKLEEFGGTLDHVQECVHPDDRQQGIDNLNKAMEHNVPFDNTYRVIYPDGSIHWLHSYGHVFKDRDSKPMKIFGVTRDITTSKNAREELIKAKELAEKNDRLKTAFINNISHEIRTPLNSIAGFGQLLVNDELSKHQRMKYIDILQKNSDRLLQTITDIMDISMIATDNIVVYPQDVRVDVFLKGILEKTRLLCADSNIIPGLEIPAGKPSDIISCDPELLDKTFWHLISNAIKFTSKGRITIGYERSDNNFIQFFVNDTGRGVAQTNQDKIFEAFIQEDISITRGHEGSGMGLTIAKGFVELLGGKIWVKSKQGEGSTFFFSLPAKTDSAKTEHDEKPPLTIQITHDPIILVAEDDESNYYYLHELLDTTGYSHLHAINGQEAVKLCKEYPEISLVLMDIKMPVLNGIEATKQIKEFRPELPIVAVTAHTQTGDKSRVMAAGCEDFITKPVPKTTLEEMIAKFIKTALI